MRYRGHRRAACTEDTPACGKPGVRPNVSALMARLLTASYREYNRELRGSLRICWGRPIAGWLQVFDNTARAKLLDDEVGDVL